MSGGNDAFIIDRERRKELISSDARSAELIRPLAKGTDISRYHLADEERYLIYVPRGTNIDSYPAIRDRLEQYRDQIGATATDEEWYELQ